MARRGLEKGRRELAAVAARLEAWRRQRRLGARIPAKLWEAAAELAGSLGVSRVATSLRLDYYSLQRRLADRSAAAEPVSPTFVELPPAPAAAPCCVVELEHASGARMRIELRNQAVDLQALAADFWTL